MYVYTQVRKCLKEWGKSIKHREFIGKIVRSIGKYRVYGKNDNVNTR